MGQERRPQGSRWARRLREGPPLTWALVLLVGVRIPLMFDPLMPDEAGYLLVAGQWDLDDERLYGAFWVDRPPLLLLLFKAANLLGGGSALRVLGLVAAVTLVLAAASVGRAVAGQRGASWCAVVAGALGSSYALGGHEVDGELLAIPLVMVSCAAVLGALDAPSESRPHDRGGPAGPRRKQLALALAAGTAGAAAVLVKQSFVDAVVFIPTVLLATWLQQRAAWRQVVGLGLTALAGAGAVMALTLVWAGTFGPGLGDLLYATYGFRLDAAEVLATGDESRPLARLAVLVLLAVASGLLPLLVGAGRALGRRAADPLAWGLAAMLLVGVGGVAAGGSFWRHYLLQLVPAAVVAVALWLRAGTHDRWLRAAVGLVVASALVSTAVGVTTHALREGPQEDALADASWLRSHAAPGDTAIVTYGHANVLYEAGLSSPYPYLWSLPLRVRDPRLDLLAHTLSGDQAPRWVVVWDDLDSWGLDASGRIRDTLARDYDQVAEVSGHAIYRREPPARR